MRNLPIKTFTVTILVRPQSYVKNCQWHNVHNVVTWHNVEKEVTFNSSASPCYSVETPDNRVESHGGRSWVWCSLLGIASHGLTMPWWGRNRRVSVFLLLLWRYTHILYLKVGPDFVPPWISEPMWEGGGVTSSCWPGKGEELPLPIDQRRGWSVRWVTRRATPAYTFMLPSLDPLWQHNLFTGGSSP